VFLSAGIWMVVTIANSESDQIVDNGSGSTAIEVSTVSDAPPTAIKCERSSVRCSGPRVGDGQLPMLDNSF
jgi:hypothetical protein